MLLKTIAFGANKIKSTLFYKLGSEGGPGGALARTNPKESTLAQQKAQLEKTLTQSDTSAIAVYDKDAQLANNSNDNQNSQLATSNKPESNLATTEQISSAMEVTQDIPLSPEQKQQLAQLITETQEDVQKISGEIQPEHPKDQPQIQATKTEAKNTAKENIFKKLARKASEYVGKLVNGDKETIRKTLNVIITGITIGVGAFAAAPAVLSLMGAAGIITGGTTLAASVLGAGSVGTFTSLGFGVAAMSTGAAVATSFGAAAGAVGLGHIASSISNKFLGKPKSAENQNAKPNEVADTAPETLVSNESREKKGKSENIKNLANGTIVNSSIVFTNPQTGQPAETQIKMIVRIAADGSKYMEARNTADQIFFNGLIFSKTEEGNAATDFSPDIIQEGSTQVLYNPQMPEGQNQFPFVLKSFDIQQPAIEAQVGETQPQIEPSKSAESGIAVNDEVSTLATQVNSEPNQSAVEPSTSTETTAKTEQIDETPEKIVFTNADGQNLIVNTKNYTSKNEAGKILLEISNHLGNKDIISNPDHYIRQKDNSDGKPTYDLDFTKSGLKFATFDEKADYTDKPKTETEVKINTEIKGDPSSKLISIKAKGQIIHFPITYVSNPQLNDAKYKLKQLTGIEIPNFARPLSGKVNIPPQIYSVLEGYQGFVGEETNTDQTQKPEGGKSETAEATAENEKTTVEDKETTTIVHQPKPHDSLQATEYLAGSGLVKIENIVKNKNDALRVWNRRLNENEGARGAVGKTVDLINSGQNEESDRGISRQDYQTSLIYAKMLEVMPESIKNLADSMTTTDEYKSQEVSLNLANAEGSSTKRATLEKYNNGLKLKIALEKMSNTVNKSVKRGEEWYDLRSAIDTKTKDGEILFSTGQIIYEAPHNDPAVRSYLFEQIAILSEKEHDTVLSPETLNKLKNGDKAALTNISDPKIQQKFGELVLKVLSGKDVADFTNPKS